MTWRYWIILLALLPTPALASVTITEVAWMGDSASANNEWLELYNNGNESVSLDGWTLIDSGNLAIDLAGAVGAGQYVLLERNRSSEDYLVKPPFLIYTGALVNTGTTLVLKRPDGTIEDQVAGGENWQAIGGDNVTKDTAQSSNNGWVTAKPSPGQIANKETTLPPTETTGGNNQTQSTGQTSIKSKSSTVKTGTTKSTSADPALTIDYDIPTRAYVNQLVTMKAIPTKIGKNLMSSLDYDWNFGDMATGSNRVVTHRYSFPGTYLVTIFVSHKGEQHLSRHEITVLPVTISLTKNSAGDVQINNDSPYDIDVSGFRVMGQNTLTFPPRSIILSKGTVTIPRIKLGLFTPANLAVFDSIGQRIVDGNQFATVVEKPTVTTFSSASIADSSLSKSKSALNTKPTPTRVTQSQPTPTRTPNTISTPAGFNFLNSDSPKSTELTGEVVTESLVQPTLTTSLNTGSTTNNQAAVASAKTKLPPQAWTYGLFILLLLLAVGSLWTLKLKDNQ